MKKPLFMLTLLLAIGLAGCGTKDSAGADTAEVAQEESAEAQDSAEAGDEATEESSTEAAADTSDDAEDTDANQPEESTPITDDQALEAIKNYCHTTMPDLEDMEKSGDYTISWEVESSDADQIVVMFRSYTGAQVRYYIDPVSGDTDVTEFVEGITDEEQPTDESFNINDYR